MNNYRVLLLLLVAFCGDVFGMQKIMQSRLPRLVVKNKLLFDHTKRYSFCSMQDKKLNTEKQDLKQLYWKKIFLDAAKKGMQSKFTDLNNVTMQDQEFKKSYEITYQELDKHIEILLQETKYLSDEQRKVFDKIIQDFDEQKRAQGQNAERIPEEHETIIKELRAIKDECSCGFLLLWFIWLFK